MPAIFLALALLIQTPLPALPRTGIVTGILRTSGGTPLEGVRVAVTPADAAVADSLLESISLTDKDGRYRLENVSPGRYHVVIGRSLSPIYHPGVDDRASATVIAVTAGAAVAVSDVVVVRVRVTGRVLDGATGVGRRVQTLQICCEYDLNGRTATGTPITVSVKDDGTFSFARGMFTIQASDPGIIPMGQLLAVADTDIDDLEVRVSNGVEVQGHVVDRVGTPVSALGVRLIPDPTGTVFPIVPSTITLPAGVSALDLSINGIISRVTIDQLQMGLRPKPQSVSVDSAGRFVIDRVLPGSYVLEVNAPGKNLVERKVEVGPRGVSNLGIEVPVTRLVGRIVAVGTEALPKMDGSIRLISSVPGSQILYIFPEADGRFYPLLAPGEYRVSTENLGHRVQSVTDGHKDLTTEPLVFDGVSKPEIVVTLEP